MSDLEKYILEHRDELDRMEAVPEEAMWQRIRASHAPPQAPKKAGFNWKLLSIAALVLALAGWGLWLFKKGEPTVTLPLQTPPPKLQAPIAEQQKQREEEQAPVADQQKETPPPAVAEALPKAKKRSTGKAKAQQPTAKNPPPVVSEDEQRLQQLVAQKQREIGLDTLDRAAYFDLLRELDELEITVQEARRDLGSGPQRERLMETLIRYYELKIKILEQINYEINKKEYHEAWEKRI
jgi:outer membrane biosynthesis protein TonB